jgi:phosphoglycolate phosphatase-like HAD superfamily hydrolase
MSKPVYLFDLDGTLSNGDHRLHHIQKTPKDWTSYFAACGDDEPIPHMIRLYKHLQFHAQILIVSGRSDEVRDLTMGWLVKHLPLPGPFNDEVLMRKAGDHRPDDVIKIEMLAEIRARGFDPIMAFDDRTRVVQAWRKAGVPCMQVAEGDF